MFVQSEKFIEDHGGKLGDVSIYGQEANPTTWRLAAMNLVIRGMDYNLGKEPADTFTRNQHPDLRADYVLGQPALQHQRLVARQPGRRRPLGIRHAPARQRQLRLAATHPAPPQAHGQGGHCAGQRQHELSQNSEGQIRAAMVDADVVEVMVALPGQLFFNTQIPACLWFLAKQKKRKGEVLFIDARKLATMISRVQSELTDEVIERISQTVAAWRSPAAPTTKTLQAFAAACPWPKSPNTAMCSPPAAMWVPKKWKTTTKPLPTRCKRSPPNWASKWPKAPSWTR
jgi:type I restriction enzyme M protein